MRDRIQVGPFTGFAPSVVYRAAASAAVSAILIYAAMSYAVARQPFPAVLIAALALYPTLEAFGFVVAFGILLTRPANERAAMRNRTPSPQEIAAIKALARRGRWKLWLFAAVILAEVWVLSVYGHRAEPALVCFLVILGFVPLFLKRKDA